MKGALFMLKHAIRAIAAAIGAALILNGIFMIIFANSTIGSYLTVLIGIIFFLPAIFIGTAKRLLSIPVFKLLAALIVCGGIVTAVMIMFLFVYGTADNVTYNEDYLIVLGCGLRGEEPTEPLRARLDTALDYLDRNETCTVIVSGGQGRGEAITEAEAMRRYLTERGVDNDRIIIEDRSTSTSENFKFSNKAADNLLAATQTAFVTNDFHIYRAYNLARLQGFTFNHIHADTSWYNLAPCYLREMLAIMKMTAFGY